MEINQYSICVNNEHGDLFTIQRQCM